MLTKDKIHQLIDHMPDSFSADDLIEEIILLQKIELAREQISNGDFLTEDEMSKEIDSWE